MAQSLEAPISPADSSSLAEAPAPASLRPRRPAAAAIALAPKARASQPQCDPPAPEPQEQIAADNRDIKIAREVLYAESSALQSLGAQINMTFSQAVSLLAQVRGRVIVSGVGKSGLIGRKIAATLSSTGRPACFLHAAEAAHGDLGMITPQDGLLALSRSGESVELDNVVAHCHKLAVPMVAITSEKVSRLAKSADVTLKLPSVSEACPLGLAPTTSSTLMLALGDALAVALLQRIHFSWDNFCALHPGGKLGRKGLKVADLMHQDDELPLCRLKTRCQDAILVMTGKHFGCVGVLDDEDRLAGIITDGDLRRAMGAQLLSAQAQAIMTPEPKTISSKTTAAAALSFMNSSAVTTLFVVDPQDDGRPRGIVHIHDCLRAGIP